MYQSMMKIKSSQSFCFIFGKKELWYDCLACNKTKEQIGKEFGIETGN